ncbi:MAG: amylosucrase, partial [Actinomycetota bacterium]
MTTTSEASVFAGFGLPTEDQLILDQRWQRWGNDLLEGLDGIYSATVVSRIKHIIAKNFAERRAVLRERDTERLLQPDWYQLPNVIGYAMYTDRFAGDLKGVAANVDYLNELGIKYLHLMPLLQPRTGPNDGGYAVANYREVRSDLGTMHDLAQLADTLHENGISLTLDFVLNHVADQHDWALRAQAGEKKYRDYFYIYPDRVVPEQYEKTLPEVFPAFAPGNFTWDDNINGWVWTTFNSWQWDLNWSNPDVFCEMLDVVLYLANQGADCLRLDAIAFIWKKLGTDCQNQAEVHAITQALRAAAHIAAPALILKAEAIVGPNQLVNYLGQGSHAGKVSEIAYHNSLMVQMWSAFAAQDARMMATALSRFPTVPTTSAWGTYIRCHDDIGWAIDDADAAAIGWNGADHRRFLSDFFIGDFPGSFSKGAAFQPNELTGDRRISGTLASLLGVERAIADKDELALEIAVARINCAYAMVYSFGGIPLLYM